MNSNMVQRLAHYLSATETRSGEAIGNELGCSRAAVWKHIEVLRSLGIEIHAVAGQGYRLKEPLELLDRDTILANLDSPGSRKLNTLVIEGSLDSTNSALQRLPLAEQNATAILAEHQSQGRGRRGRQWYSPYGKNLYLSLGWMFEKSLSELGCLPLVVALATSQALRRAGLEGHGVKWPNDLLIGGKKLCGCLAEVQGDSQGPCHAVLGVGINVHMPVSSQTKQIDQPWTDLHSHLPGFSRNALAALLLEELVGQLSMFDRQGFAPFREHWEQLDILHGKPVEVQSVSDSIRGTACGIDEHGALMLDTGQEVLKLHSGEVSLHKTKL
ncbi:MAG: bifunctional biotin--[acetyl-CoA-carboxylase] ligase/biotin operon repressor BirA [Xanthomonadales bacterium]|nr:bifunctional biotin--[acetyl-CoA-carboxylase] ligase/biotin operon repressor BirA [Gammaproteobacteria bacterium]NNK04537.1 bifunctional biotin--[acetyl-CoA-carboxylase] ligase/biotin operon repressor BirA [Xanthomonadales bacterium]NNL00029.1 bifunctional biotin--[acetyl-CoA-carboxylase] ligase/biotin operon repressor BirA [Xanthomonadales bacterium]